MLAGGVMVFVWKYVIAHLSPVFNIYELLPAFVIGLVVNVVVSLITPTSEKSIADNFNEVKAINKK
jgi:sodium/proline symporter